MQRVGDETCRWTDVTCQQCFNVTSFAQRMSNNDDDDNIEEEEEEGNSVSTLHFGWDMSVANG
jgi:hypothetical protein